MWLYIKYRIFESQFIMCDVLTIPTRRHVNARLHAARVFSWDERILHSRAQLEWKLNCSNIIHNSYHSSRYYCASCFFLYRILSALTVHLLHLSSALRLNCTVLYYTRPLCSTSLTPLRLVTVPSTFSNNE